MEENKKNMGRFHVYIRFLGISWCQKTCKASIIPAPVVPPARVDVSTDGDCRTEISCPWTTTSTAFDLESINPRFPDGMSCEKSRKVSIYKNILVNLRVYI